MSGIGKDGEYRFDQYVMRADMVAAVQRYVQHGISPGGFLTAVICNDLVGALNRADDDNRANLIAVVGYFMWEVPAPAWGSKEKMQEWIKSKQEKR